MRKTLFIFLIALLPIVAFGQLKEYLEDDPEPTITKHRGLAYSLLETGSGLGFFYEFPIEQFFHLGAGFDAFMLRDRNEINYVDIYGYNRVYGKQNNVFLFDLLFTAKKRLFVEQVDDSFRPFVMAGVGPVFGMNFPEADRDTQGVKLKNQFRWTAAAVIGVGLDADVDGKYFFGFRTQYRFMPFSEKLGERSDHSMIDIRLEIGQRF